MVVAGRPADWPVNVKDAVDGSAEHAADDGDY